MNAKAPHFMTNSMGIRYRSPTASQGETCSSGWPLSTPCGQTRGPLPGARLATRPFPASRDVRFPQGPSDAKPIYSGTGLTMIRQGFSGPQMEVNSSSGLNPTAS